MDLKIYPSSLKGSVVVPASKSITHRYLICAALSNGKSIIKNPLICDDTIATISALKNLGAKFKIDNDKITVKGCGVPKYKDRSITVLESATTLRMLLPLLVLFSSKLAITSSMRLVDRIYTSDLFDLKGLHFQRDKHTIKIDGKLTEKVISLSGKITTQLISGILLALPYLGEDVVLEVYDITFENPYLMLTLDAMNKFGINYEISNNRIKVSKNQKYTSTEVRVESDFSNGAIWLAASYFHRNLNVVGLNMSSLQGDRQMVHYMNEMGVQFSYTGNTFNYDSGVLSSAKINVNDTPDLAPILVSLASLANGTVIIRGTAKLKYKESNRKLVIMDLVNALGGSVRLLDSDIVIEGKERLKGGVRVDSFNDHRMVMAIAIIATVCQNPVIINDFQVVNKSYPEFFTALTKLGAKVEVL